GLPGAHGPTTLAARPVLRMTPESMPMMPLPPVKVASAPATPSLLMLLTWTPPPVRVRITRAAEAVVTDNPGVKRSSICSKVRSVSREWTSRPERSPPDLDFPFRKLSHQLRGIVPLLLHLTPDP